MKYAKYFLIVAAGLAIAGCGGPGKKPNKHVQVVHQSTAAVIAKQVNSQVEAGGVVLLVHRQASEPIAQAWEEGLVETLDSRFNLVTYTLEHMSEGAAASEQGAVPLGEGMQKNGGAVAVISAIQVDPEPFTTLSSGEAMMFALEWPFLELAGPLLSGGQLKAGVFEREHRDVSAKAAKDASPELTMSARYLLATPENWQSMVGL